jgi:hypothetical protein
MNDMDKIVEEVIAHKAKMEEEIPPSISLNPNQAALATKIADAMHHDFKDPKEGEPGIPSAEEIVNKAGKMKDEFAGVYPVTYWEFYQVLDALLCQMVHRPS